MNSDGMRETETRDSGEVLRHELNNPLTGILGNAELFLVELRRQNVDLPAQARSRLETIAALAVRMRETVRWLSEQCESQALGFRPVSSARPEIYANPCRPMDPAETPGRGS